MVTVPSQTSYQENSTFVSPFQKSIINILLKSKKPLSLAEISYSFSKRPCAKKLIPHIVNLKEKGILVCEPKGINCMDFEFRLTEKGWEIVSEQNV